MKATKVNAGLAESSGKLLLGIWRDQLRAQRSVTSMGKLYLFTFNSKMLGSRVVSMLDLGAEGPGFKSQPRCSVLGKLFTPIVPLFTKQQNW